MPYPESDLLPISALHHLVYCERSCALVHLEQAWAENRFTAEGRVLHERTLEHETESRGDLRVAYGLRLRSLELGISGIADAVEFHRLPETGDPGEGVTLHRAPGRWRPFPVEYKHGRPKPHNADRAQLCAQALCLEEMLQVAVPRGALFYGKTRRREDVAFDAALRAETAALAARLHQLIASGRTPPPVYDSKKCGACSLLELCRPRLLARAPSVEKYLAVLRDEQCAMNNDQGTGNNVQ